MKNLALINLKNILYVSLCCVFIIACKKDQKPSDKESYDLAAKSTSSSCSCKPNWFPHSQTPPPEEGKGSPFDVSSTTNCIFHQWSWQKFLWLTKPDTNNNPLFLNQLTQVSDALIPVQKPAGVTIILNSATDIEQAGTNGVLKANPVYSGNNEIAKDYTVYYSIHSNAIMMNAAKNIKDSLASGKLNPTNLRTFPVGSLELKASWIDANTIMTNKQKNYFITTASVTANGNTSIKKVALLGMHVVGVVINHPEFVWATFQHNDLAPVYDWKNNQATSADDKLLYSKGTTSGIDGITWTNGPNLPLKPFDLFQHGVPKTAGDHFMQTSQSEPMNFDNIQSINACVASNLNDVWNNYFYNGSIWINTDGMTPQQQAQTIVNLGNSIGNAAPNSSARGSLSNANITMETYAQTFQGTIGDINVSNLINCFSCHTAVSLNKNRSPMYLSHIFDDNIQSSQGKTRNQINRIKDQQQILRFVKKAKK